MKVSGICNEQTFQGKFIKQNHVARDLFCSTLIASSLLGLNHDKFTKSRERELAQTEYRQQPQKAQLSRTANYVNQHLGEKPNSMVGKLWVVGAIIAGTLLFKSFEDKNT